MSGNARPLQPESEFITAKEVADRIGRSIDWVHRVRHKPGEGPPYYLIGGRYLYRPAEIMAWLRSRRGG
jgi:predicted DNA-binding transcriptional regulator AlpA